MSFISFTISPTVDFFNNKLPAGGGRRKNHFTTLPFYLVSENRSSFGYVSLEEPAKWKMFRETDAVTQLPLIMQF